MRFILPLLVFLICSCGDSIDDLYFVKIEGRIVDIKHVEQEVLVEIHKLYCSGELDAKGEMVYPYSQRICAKVRFSTKPEEMKLADGTFETFQHPEYFVGDHVFRTEAFQKFLLGRHNQNDKVEMATQFFIYDLPSLMTGAHIGMRRRKLDN